MPNILFRYSPPSTVSKTQSRRVHEEQWRDRETNMVAGVTDDIGWCSAEGNNASMEARNEYIEITQFLMLLYPPRSYFGPKFGWSTHPFLRPIILPCNALHLLPNVLISLYLCTYFGFPPAFWIFTFFRSLSWFGCFPMVHGSSCQFLCAIGTHLNHEYIFIWQTLAF